MCVLRTLTSSHKFLRNLLRGLYHNYVVIKFKRQQPENSHSPTWNKSIKKANDPHSLFRLFFETTKHIFAMRSAPLVRRLALTSTRRFHSATTSTYIVHYNPPTDGPRPSLPIRAFSTNLKDNKDDQGKEDDESTHNEEDLLGEDAVSEDKEGSLEGEKEKGAKEEGAEEKGASSSTSFDASSFIPSGYDVRQSLLAFSDGVKETWHELINPDRSSNFKKRIAEPMSKGESDARKDEHGEYAGPSELMMVKGEKDAWERMRARMASAPIIEDVLKAAGKVYSSEGVKKTREKLGDISEDAREAWETSQNPWVYRISSIIDTFSAEDEFAVAVRELRRLDPNFDMEDWRYNLGEAFLIPFIQDYMRSDLKALKPWIHGEGMKRKIEGEIRTRKQEGVR